MPRDRSHKPHSPLRRLWDYSAGQRWAVVRATARSIINKALDIAPPFLIGMAVDIVVRRQDSFLSSLGWTDPRQQLMVLAVLSFLVWSLESLFEYLQAVEWRNLAQTVEHGLRVDAYTHVQRLGLSFHEEQSTGELMAVLNDDVNQLERFLDYGANEVIQTAVATILIGAIFAVMVPDAAWLAFAPMPFIVWWSLRFQRRMESRYAAVRHKAGAINATLSNNLSGIQTIKAFTAEEREIARVTRASEQYREANRSAIKLSSAFSPLIRVAVLVGFTAILIVGGFQALDGTLNVGVYSVLVYLTQRLLWPLTELGQTLDLYQRAMASTVRILDVLDTPDSMTDGTGRLPSVRGDVAFDGVTFAYSTGDPVLRNVSFSVPAGSTFAIVGATGSGKTSIIKLLLRYYDPQRGAVRLDGHDVRQVAVADVRGAMALVSQDIFLFHGTVEENILYGRPDAHHDDVVAAAKIAEAHDFITAFPDGYGTVVGERGQKLSGGQRQRISIARAILSDAPILILDEATSAVDNETEAAIQRSLAQVAHDLTTVTTAPGISTIRHADEIIVVDGGVITQRGTHDTLSVQPGIYQALWTVQTGEAGSR